MRHTGKGTLKFLEGENILSHILHKLYLDDLYVFFRCYFRLFIENLYLKKNIGQPLCNRVKSSGW